MKSFDIVSFLNKCFDEALRRNASDIHIDSSATGVNILFRINGVLSLYDQVPPDYVQQLFSRIKVLIDGDMSLRNLPQEGRFSYENKTSEVVDMRVIVFPVIDGEKVVIRLLNRRGFLLDMADLGMSDGIKSKLEQNLSSMSGLVLVSGPTGSGKTTTLYACLNRIMDKQLHVLTVEDPVEYKLDGANQIQVNSSHGVTFATALKYMLRMDPDIILVGEIRDPETAMLACSAALTGHLVLATVHAGDCISAVTRLYDMGVKPYALAHSLSGVLSQKLVPKFCSVCNGVGCNACYGSGIISREACYSYLQISEEMSSALAEPPYSRTKILRLAIQGYYRSFEQEADERLKNGLITHREHALILQGVEES